MTASLFGQSEFTPGFYIIKNGAKYAQQATYPDFDSELYIVSREVGLENYNAHYAENEDIISPGYGVVTTLDGEYLYTHMPPEGEFEAVLREGQIVIAYMTINEKVLCFDMLGHPIIFSSINDLAKAPSTGSIGIMNDEAEEIMDGPTLCCGFYWILSQNTANGTVKIQLSNSTVDLRVEKISFWKKYMTRVCDNIFEAGDEEGVKITTVR